MTTIYNAKTAEVNLLILTHWGCADWLVGIIRKYFRVNWFFMEFAAGLILLSCFSLPVGKKTPVFKVWNLWAKAVSQLVALTCRWTRAFVCRHCQKLTSCCLGCWGCVSLSCLKPFRPAGDQPVWAALGRVHQVCLTVRAAHRQEWSATGAAQLPSLLILS